MIVKPENMNFSDKNIIMIISGLPGVGKACADDTKVLTDMGFPFQFAKSRRASRFTARMGNFTPWLACIRKECALATRFLLTMEQALFAMRNTSGR